jgi:hypothetical protein
VKVATDGKRYVREVHTPRSGEHKVVWTDARTPHDKGEALKLPTAGWTNAILDAAGDGVKLEDA